MTRFLVALCIAAILVNAAPASAHRPRPTPEPTDELISAVSDPCDLTAAFIPLKATIDHLETVTLKIQDDSLKLHHTARSTPYKTIEDAWEEIVNLANPALDELSTFPIALDATPQGPRKKAALALIRSYQKAIDHLVDAGHFAVNNERSENMLSMNVKGNLLGFGVSADWTRSASNNLIRRKFDSSLIEANEAVLSRALPEKRYARICSKGSAPLAHSVQTVTDACELREPLFAMRETIRRMGDEAGEAGEVTARLKATSRRRPYKLVEDAWFDLLSSTRTTKTALSEFAIELDAAPDTPQKAAAQELIEADKKAVERIFGYAGATVGLERTQNNLSMNFQREFVTFGVSKQAPRTASDNSARQEFNKKFAEPENTIYSLKIPEYHYAKLCPPTT